MPKLSNPVDQAEALRVVAAAELQRHIVHRKDCDGQLPMFDAALPARPATPLPSPELAADAVVVKSEHLDLLKRVLLAKYLRRCLSLSYAHIGRLLNCDKGTACRLDHYRLSVELASLVKSVPAEAIVDEGGVSISAQPNQRLSH